MILDRRQRAELVRRILRGLEESVPRSRAQLRGSLAGDVSDEYSDIDITWRVPADDFLSCLQGLGETLSRIGPVESTRWDPEYRGRGDRRLVFVRFAGVPLFWRVDFDISSDAKQASPLKVEQDDLPWSLTESALMNAVAAIKAHVRGRDADAVPLLSRAYDRVGVELVRQDLKTAILQLVDSIEKMDSATRPLCSRIKKLAEEAFFEQGAPSCPHKPRR